MTPNEVEAWFERIEMQLELLARYSASTAARVDVIAEKLERLEAQVDKVSRDVAKVSRDVASLVNAVGSLVKLFERHIQEHDKEK